MEYSNNKYIVQLLDRLKQINPEKIILFGSQAHGNAGNDSDIDIVVVTNDEFFPQNYRQRADLTIKVSRIISDIMKEIPVDLIVYSKPMYQKLLAMESLFSKELTKNGKILYEASH